MRKLFLALVLLTFGGAVAQAQPQTGAAQYLEDQPTRVERVTHAPPPGAVRVRQQPVRAAAPQHHNSPYKGYWYGARNPQELADIVERALRRDPTGRSLLSAERCRQNGSCAAPINYVESMRAHDPNGNWTLGNLVEKMRSLRLDCTVRGVYQMDRIVYTGGALGQTDVNGMSRSFHANECAWVNPDTGAPVLAQNCANPVGQRIDIDCVVIVMETRIVEERIVDWQRRRNPTDQCFATRHVTRPYESQFTGPSWNPIRPGRIGNDNCSFCEYNRTFGYRPVSEGSIRLERGFTQVRIARNEPIDWCLKSWDRGFVRSSFTNGINWPDDYSLVGREHFARIYYSSAEMEAAGFRLGQPKARFWWAVNDNDEARIRASYGGR